MEEKALIIGIAGASGFGKTCLAKAIENRIGEKVAFLSHDNYYKRHDELSLEDRAKLNYDHPDALETDLMVLHLDRLRHGEAIDCPVYDFAEHNRSDKVKHISPQKVIIVEGILVLQNHDLRDMMDLKVYVDTPQEIYLIRRLKRDVLKRGRTTESVIKQYEDTVLPMFKRFVQPTKAYANIIVPNGGKDQAVQDMIINHILIFLDT